MELIGLGVDIIEVQRIERAAQRPTFLSRVFTPAELEAFEAGGKHRYRRLAARFAAKEATLKALGTGLRGGRWVEIEVKNDPLGKPFIELHGFFAAEAQRRGIQRLLLSLSHAEAYAVAQVLALGGPTRPI